MTDAYLPLPGDSSDPWVVLFKQIRDRYAPSLPWDQNVVYGMAQAYTMVQVLKAAGRNPTRDGLRQTVESHKLGGGPGRVPFGYSPGNHLGFLGVQIATIGTGGAVKTVGSPSVSSDGGPITPYSGAPSTPPTGGIPAD